MTVSTRHQFILKHFSLVEHVARKLYQRLPNYIEIDELIAVGAVGLIDAANRYQDDRGVPFERYAEIRIQGSMIDFLRQQDWVPRSVRERARDLESRKNNLTKELGRAPTAREVAKSYGLSLMEYRSKETQSQILSLVSAETPIGEDGCSIGDLMANPMPDQLSLLENEERTLMLNRALERLDLEDRHLLRRSFFQEHTLKDIGAELGVTESRACQLRQRALRRLRKQLATIQECCPAA